MTEYPSQAGGIQVSESLTGKTIGRFVMGECLGKGGMGEVYRAEDTRLKRTVALKRLSVHLRSDPIYRRRFEEEAERASSLNDAHVAAVYDVIEVQGEIFLVMEFVEGQNLRQRIQAPLSLEQFFGIAVQCAQALVAAHGHGIVHCDIKPENIMLTPEGQIKILDFGVAKHLIRPDQSTTVDRSRSVSGTPAYMLGTSLRMREVFEFIRRVAPTDSTVLVQGESGTGKEMVARAIHRNSSRAERPFVAINCAAITETLLESEMFGHEKGAFTGAVAQKKGKMEAADGGTLFLDEVSELAPSLQAKLLRVLQEREFERVGGTRPLKLDIRVIAATNRLLPEAVQSGTFRKDLYYRLNVVALTMPPLRERREDIPLLADRFVAKASRKCKTRVKALSAAARACLMNYDWPGNVRELENAVERALVLGSTEYILPDDLPEAVLEAGAPITASAGKYLGTVKELKKQLILQSLQEANGSYIEAAGALGMHPNSLLRLIRNLDLKAAVKAGLPASKAG